MLVGNHPLYFHGLNFPIMKRDGDPGAFRPSDFAEVLVQLPEGCPIVGGQAVVWWAERYRITAASHQPLTSEDIDFWGGRADLKQLASKLGIKPIFPHAYEMSVRACSSVGGVVPQSRCPWSFAHVSGGCVSRLKVCRHGPQVNNC